MPKDHLATFVCPGFVVKFNNQNITAVESHVAYHFLAGRTSILKPRSRSGAQGSSSWCWAAAVGAGSPGQHQLVQPITTTCMPQPFTTTCKSQPITTTCKPWTITTTCKPQPITTTYKPQPITTTCKPQPIATTCKPQPIPTACKPQPITTNYKPQPITTT